MCADKSESVLLAGIPVVGPLAKELGMNQKLGTTANVTVQCIKLLDFHARAAVISAGIVGSRKAGELSSDDPKKTLG